MGKIPDHSFFLQVEIARTIALSVKTAFETLSKISPFMELGMVRSGETAGGEKAEKRDERKLGSKSRVKIMVFQLFSLTQNGKRFLAIIWQTFEKFDSEICQNFETCRNLASFGNT